MADTERNGTRWGRSAVLGVPSLVLLVLLGLGVTRGALADHVVIQGGTFEFTTSGLYGEDFALGVVENPRKVRGPDDTVTVEDIRLGRVGFAQGALNELCIAVHQTVAGQDFTIKLVGGDDDPATWEIDARNVELDGLRVQGNLTLDGVVKFGITAEDTTTIENSDGTPVANPLEADAAEHRFGVDASIAEFSRVTGTVYAMEIVGPFDMPGLEVTVEGGTTSCPEPAAPSGTP